MTGTLKSSFLMKNFRNGTVPWKVMNRISISAHDWWLQLMKYHWFLLSPSRPCMSYLVGWVERMIVFMPTIQQLPKNMIAFAQRRCHESERMSSLVIPKMCMGVAQKRVFMTTSEMAMTPRTVGGRYEIILKPHKMSKIS